ncbi:Putative restriction endonuclease [Singulisphaera sp. GP187]|uniref:Uma2 family endonuclease n=1 Tax=Singulisphaera sp. GP187 TaxID=1882752 RepID=UPI000927FB60|nr:Uma2 family endonuclease [Singulisphaera sp. GP187]SIO36394.1 Putative restriction endonuclease [Singulisphaera sp. GP187]
MFHHGPVIDPSRPLVEGERLDQPTFHARCEAMPPGTWAELIGGVVFLPSPAGRAHGYAHIAAAVWLSYYAENTPGVEGLDHATTILGSKSEPKPDALLRILPECGGQTRTERGYVRGAPELVVEIAQATRDIDLGSKLADYEQAGVLEYVVHAMNPDEVLWFRQENGSLVMISADADGLYRSTIFPGLWLDPQALLNGETKRLRALLDQGLATAEHAALVTRLAAFEAK